ncbi:MAG TPA: hypothetical protein VMY77_03155 [Chitinophagaceae bacterium]|nr:hypothetical protein [Chitinophagaceae bacterium]
MQDLTKSPITTELPKYIIEKAEKKMEKENEGKAPDKKNSLAKIAAVAILNYTYPISKYK